MKYNVKRLFLLSSLMLLFILFSFNGPNKVEINNDDDQIDSFEMVNEIGVSTSIFDGLYINYSWYFCIECVFNLN